MQSASPSSLRRPVLRGNSNRLDTTDRAAHDWYRFVLSFPPHLVRDYVNRFGLAASATVLDPFCGTGTTIIECKKVGFQSIGVEAHPMSHFALCTKIDWSPDPDALEKIASDVAGRVISLGNRRDDLESRLNNSN
jgi:DNA methylase